MSTLTITCKDRTLKTSYLPGFFDQNRTLKTLQKWCNHELALLSPEINPNFTLTITRAPAEKNATLLTEIPANPDVISLEKGLNLRADILTLLQYSENLSCQEISSSLSIQNELKKHENSQKNRLFIEKAAEKRLQKKNTLIFKLTACQQRISELKNAFKPLIYIGGAVTFLCFFGSFIHFTFLKIGVHLGTIGMALLIFKLKDLFKLKKESGVKNRLGAELKTVLKEDILDKVSTQPSIEKTKGLHFQAPKRLNAVSVQSRSSEPRLKHAQRLVP